MCLFLRITRSCPIGWPAGDRHGHSRTKPTGLPTLVAARDTDACNNPDTEAIAATVMPRSATRFVHGFVHETLRDGARHGRRRGPA